MATKAEELSVYHTPFFVTYIVVGCVFLVLHFRLIMGSNILFRYLIQTTASLAVLPTFRVIQHASIACFINIVSQIVAVSCTINRLKMDITINTIIGAIYQGTWSTEYPMILFLAVNRLMSVASPSKFLRLWDLKLAFGIEGDSVANDDFLLVLCWGRLPVGAKLDGYHDAILKKGVASFALCNESLISFCWIYGAFNATLCLSGQVRTIWQIRSPGFVFDGVGFIADFLYYMDLYFAEFVLFASLFCYLAMFIVSITRRNSMGSFKAELPMTLHFGTVFVMSSVVLFLWHVPLSRSALYSHVFNLINLLRYCMYPVLTLITNSSIRSQFVPGVRPSSVISFSNYPSSR